MLNNFSNKSSPHHVTQDDVSTPLQRLEVEKVTGHQSVLGRDGVIAVMYETHWTGLYRPSWEREMDLQLYRHEILRYWASAPNRHRQTNRRYRRMRIGVAQREFSRRNDERFLAPGYGSFRTQNGLAATAPRCFPTETTFGTRPTTACGGLGRSVRARLRMGYIWCAFWMTRDRSIILFLRRATRLGRELYEFLVSTSTLS